MTETVTTRASVAIDRASRFGKQLTNHLGRKAGGEWDAETQSGWVTLVGQRATFVATEETLELETTAPSDDLEKIESIIGRHLVGFVRDPELIVSWVRSDGSAAPEQQYSNTAE
ncbi:MAG: DUF2218 domain-containing protein [Canibacter sp.]